MIIVTVELVVAGSGGSVGRKNDLKKKIQVSQVPFPKMLFSLKLEG